MSDPSDISLSKFEEPIQFAGETKPLNICAFRMDGSKEGEKKIPSMAEYANLGGISICDYLYIHEDKAILIEDTRLGWKLKDSIKAAAENILKVMDDNPAFKKISGETAERLKKFILQNEIASTVNENLLKVYGSLLVLCRLEREEKISLKLSNKSFEFWFVITDEEDIKAIEDSIPDLEKNLETALSGKLKGAKLAQKIQVLLKTQCEDKIKELNEK